MRRAAPSSRRLSLRLYVAGKSPNSMTAIENANAVLLEHYPALYDLEVVDMLLHPERALADGIIVTPTLIKLAPLPIRRVIGSLDDTQQLLIALAGD